ncbi:MAG TPA: RpiB/LacA/LacB family sugar-phosphate isomerase [Candidatus Nanoarchaeia archaeon]
MIYLASDHAGFELKEKVKKYLQEKGLEIEDLGAHTLDKNDDYPDYGYPVAKKVADSGGKAKGLLFCGSAEGICIVANKVKGIRAVAVWTTTNAKHSREHNDANVLCLSGGKTRTPIPGLSTDEAKKIIDIWLMTPFSGVERHKRRIDKIGKIENG